MTLIQKTAGFHAPDQRPDVGTNEVREASPDFPALRVANEIVRLVECASSLLRRGAVSDSDPLTLQTRAEAACEVLDKIGWLADLSASSIGGAPWNGVNFEDWACGDWDGTEQAGMLHARLRYLRSVLPATGSAQ